MKINHLSAHLLIALMLFIPAALMGQEVSADTSLEVVQTPRVRHFSVGVLGGVDRNYHIINMSYMTDYTYPNFTLGKSLGVQLGYSPWKWLTFRVDGVLVEKNYSRDHLLPYNAGSYPDTTTNQYLNVPVVVMLNVGKTIRLHAFGGVYGGYWLTSHRKGRTMAVFGSPEYDEEVDLDSEESQIKYNRKDGGFTYGVGLSGVIAQRIELGAEARWYYGIYDIQKEYMMNLNPRYNTTFVLQAGLSYWF